MKPRIAVKILLGIVIAVTLFHLCILLKVIPYDITWGGRLTNDTEMYVFETFSIGLNLILGMVLLFKGNLIKPLLPIKMVNVVLWVFLILFAVNTVGNLFAETNFEKGLSVITLACSLFLWIILRSKGAKKIKSKS
ncbi:hypothetical protein FEE95_17635 [Maribacter algarum]|uniref:Uncharacterized protein n=1 Tax=Maribacter algarum (ex Zhang et al. 2020) TaxID=2578118 RepID=A0A5S3PHG3_9FLAO|nr:hypothetical protein [Maribacter algarum]TMM53720.1 hypothetical protein FEE95_17635 [Maribacter algarum]